MGSNPSQPWSRDHGWVSDYSLVKDRLTEARSRKTPGFFVFCSAMSLDSGWDERRYLDDLQRRLPPEDAAGMRRMLSIARAAGGRIEWKSENQDSQGKANVIFDRISGSPLYRLWSL